MIPLASKVESTALRAERIFREMGWIWYDKRRPTKIEIEETLWELIGYVRQRLVEGAEHTYSSTGRLAVHGHRWEDGTTEIFINIEMENQHGP